MSTTEQVRGTGDEQAAQHDWRNRVAAYRRFHAEGEGGDVEARKQHYADMVRSYYDLVTEFYERGWGPAFHFAPRKKHETREASILRHEHFLAARLGLRPGMRVLDVGCGVGGPLRELAIFSGASIVGVNNNRLQVEKGNRYLQQAGLDDRCEIVQTDFMQLPMEDESFDAIYAIEATCHAPDKTALFRELARVLKPGGQFAGYEWCLTDRYDPADSEHRRIKKGIEEGDGLPDIATTHETDAALEGAGFEVLEARDMAPESDPETPWYLPLTGRERTMLGLRRTPIGRRLTWAFIYGLERLRVAPRGSVQVSRVLNVAADALVEAGERDIFTPMYFFHGRRS